MCFGAFLSMVLITMVCVGGRWALGSMFNRFTRITPVTGCGALRGSRHRKAVRRLELFLSKCIEQLGSGGFYTKDAKRESAQIRGRFNHKELCSPRSTRSHLSAGRRLGAQSG